MFDCWKNFAVAERFSSSVSVFHASDYIPLTAHLFRHNRVIVFGTSSRTLGVK